MLYDFLAFVKELLYKLFWYAIIISVSAAVLLIFPSVCKRGCKYYLLQMGNIKWLAVLIKVFPTDRLYTGEPSRCFNGCQSIFGDTFIF